MKRVLVTGASGFLGRHLQASLATHSAEIITTGRAGIGNISDKECWKIKLDETRPKLIYHLLGVTDARDEAAFDAAHVHPVRALLEAALELGLTEIPIFLLGSAAEYGNVPSERQPIAETEAPHSVGSYGRSKLRATEAALEFARLGLRTVVVRVFNLFGHGMSPGMMPGSILAQLQAGSPEIKTGPLDRVRDFLPVDLAMEALAQLGTHDNPGGTVLNLCSGQGLSLSAIVHVMLEAAGRPKDLVVGGTDSIRSEGVMQSIGNPERLSKILGFRPRPPTLSDFAQLV